MIRHQHALQYKPRSFLNSKKSSELETLEASDEQITDLVMARVRARPDVFNPSIHGASDTLVRAAKLPRSDVAAQPVNAPPVNRCMDGAKGHRNNVFPDGPRACFFCERLCANPNSLSCCESKCRKKVAQYLTIEVVRRSASL